MEGKYDKKTLQQMKIFSDITDAPIKDCFEEDDKLYFIVEEGYIGQAVGKNGNKIKKIQNKLNKNVKVIEFSPEPVEFIENIIYPLEADEIEEDDGVITIRSEKRKTKGRIIGRKGKNLNMVEDTAQRYFNIDEVKVE